MKPEAARPRSYGDGGAQWAIPQASIERWLADTAFAAGTDSFRAAMRHHAKGVAIITAGAEHPVGFCATSLASVSLEPPMVSFTVGRGSTSCPVVQISRYVMVHLIAEDQAEVARLFGRADTAKFGPGTRWHRDAFGLPVLDDALAWLLLALTSHIPVGDHMLVIGRVIASRRTADGHPLIHRGGEFTRLATG